MNKFHSSALFKRSAQRLSKLRQLWTSIPIKLRVLENTAKLKPVTEWTSDNGIELYHFLLCCSDIQIGKTTMASQRNISF